MGNRREALIQLRFQKHALSPCLHEFEPLTNYSDTLPTQGQVKIIIVYQTKYLVKNKHGKDYKFHLQVSPDIMIHFLTS